VRRGVVTGFGQRGLFRGLARGAVVRLVVGVADALYGLAAGGQGCPKRPWTAMSLRKAGDFFGKVAAGFRVEAVDPEFKGCRGWR